MHGQNGRLVDFFDKDALVEEVTRLLDNASEREELGRAARKLIVNNYDLASICLPKQLSWVESLV
ncbi:hypothetical protein [Lentibacter algarum]|uniref:hypothetical protein n=1 Tax=Lentibacter algarum TaxID=576131 RepID=UPI003AF4CCAB